MKLASRVGGRLSFYEEKKQDIIGCPGELGNALAFVGE